MSEQKSEAPVAPVLSAARPVAASPVATASAASVKTQSVVLPAMTAIAAAATLDDPRWIEQLSRAGMGSSVVGGAGGDPGIEALSRAGMGRLDTDAQGMVVWRPVDLRGAAASRRLAVSLGVASAVSATEQRLPVYAFAPESRLVYLPPTPMGRPTLPPTPSHGHRLVLSNNRRVDDEQNWIRYADWDALTGQWTAWRSSSMPTLLTANTGDTVIAALGDVVLMAYVAGLGRTHLGGLGGRSLADSIALRVSRDGGASFGPDMIVNQGRLAPPMFAMASTADFPQLAIDPDTQTLWITWAAGVGLNAAYPVAIRGGVVTADGIQWFNEGQLVGDVQVNGIPSVVGNTIVVAGSAPDGQIAVTRGDVRPDGVIRWTPSVALTPGAAIINVGGAFNPGYWSGSHDVIIEPRSGRAIVAVPMATTNGYQIGIWTSVDRVGSPEFATRFNPPMVIPVVNYPGFVSTSTNFIPHYQFLPTLAHDGRGHVSLTFYAANNSTGGDMMNPGLMLYAASSAFFEVPADFRAWTDPVVFGPRAVPLPTNMKAGVGDFSGTVAVPSGVFGTPTPPSRTGSFIRASFACSHVEPNSQGVREQVISGFTAQIDDPWSAAQLDPRRNGFPP